MFAFPLLTTNWHISGLKSPEKVAGLPGCSVYRLSPSNKILEFSKEELQAYVAMRGPMTDRDGTRGGPVFAQIQKQRDYQQQDRKGKMPAREGDNINE